MRIDSAAGAYQGVTITYRVDGGQLNEPLTVARIAGQQVTQQSLPSSPYPDRSVARLSVRYPHPDGKAGYALAELVVETRTPPNEQPKKSTWQQWVDTVASTARDILPGMKLGDDVHEAWAMDVSKNDLDRVVAGMVQSGYFANPSKATMGVELAARIDTFQANKHWSREPELDILMERIRNEGQLVSYVHPVEAHGPVIAAGNVRLPAQFASQQGDGPALMPAGPQHQSYSNPFENRTPARAPQSAPPATNFTPAPYTPPSYAPGSMPTAPAAPTTVSPYPRAGMPNLVRPPAATPNAPPAAELPSKTPQPRMPQSRMPQSRMPQSRAPQSKQPSSPTAKSNNRWQYPPQYRRQPGTSAAPAGPGAAGAAPAAAPQAATRNPAQPRQQRSPWRRPDGDAKQPSPASPPANAAKGPAAPGSQRPWGAARQQPPAAGRVQPRYPIPPGSQAPYQSAPRSPATPYGSAQSDSSPTYPQTTEPTSTRSPEGIPQPPQLGSRPSSVY